MKEVLIKIVKKTKCTAEERIHALGCVTIHERLLTHKNLHLMVC